MNPMLRALELLKATKPQPQHPSGDSAAASTSSTSSPAATASDQPTPASFLSIYVPLDQIDVLHELQDIDTNDRNAWVRRLLAGLTPSQRTSRLIDLVRTGEYDTVDRALQVHDADAFDWDVVIEDDRTLLLLLIEENRLQLAKQVQQMGAAISVKTKCNKTTAHLAARYADESMLTWVLTIQPDLATAIDAFGRLPLHDLCTRPPPADDTDDVDSVIDLLGMLCRLTQQQADTTEDDKNMMQRLAEDEEGRIALHEAILAGNAQLFDSLLDRNASEQARHRAHVRAIDFDINLQKTGCTALHLACQVDNYAFIKKLINLDNTPNVQDALGRTPLHYAAQHCTQKPIFDLLKKMGQDANKPDKEYMTPLYFALSGNKMSNCLLLLDTFQAQPSARMHDGSTLMHVAAERGYIELVQMCLDRGVYPLMPNKTGSVPLHAAASHGHVNVINLLIASGTPVSIRNKFGYTSLHIATESGKPEVIECLLGHGADVQVAGGEQGQTALHLAASLTNEAATVCADMLLKSGCEPNHQQTDGRAALHMAATMGQLAMVQLLLAEGADPSQKDEAGRTPLQLAVQHCHFPLVKAFVEHITQAQQDEGTLKMLVNEKQKDGCNAMHLAGELTSADCHYAGQDAAIMQILVKSGGDIALTSDETNEGVLHKIGQSGNLAVLQTLIEHVGPGEVQICINKQSKTGMAPLMEASARGHTSVVSLMLEHHARLDVFDSEGRTALHFAALNGHTTVVDALLQSKAFVNNKNKLGETATHYAALTGHIDIIELLVVKYKASLETMTTETNETPLHYAAKSGHDKLVARLVGLKAKTKARDVNGRSPLHLAAENDRPSVVKMFLESGDREVLTAVDDNGFTCAHIAALKGSLAVVRELMKIDKAMVIAAKTKSTEATCVHMAAQEGHAAIVKVLVKNGADPFGENSQGFSPLLVAARHGRTSILDCFDRADWSRCSAKTGLNAAHVAGYFGHADFLRAVFAELPPTSRTTTPEVLNPLIVRDYATEYGLSALHMASSSGHLDIVRLMLNMPGVAVNVVSASMNVLALHLAAYAGHISVVGMLLSRSTQQLDNKDIRGRTALHLAAVNGHHDMVALLINQGAKANAQDVNDWTPLHHATKAGHTDVVCLLVEKGAECTAESRDGHTPLAFAASYNHLPCLIYLLHQPHDTNLLMTDKKFIFDLMVCGKSTENKPIQEFVLCSKAPLETAVRLSSAYKDLSEKEKERARDLIDAQEYCQVMAYELISIAASEYDATSLLKAHDERGKAFLDVLIEHAQKDVVSHPAVQQYMTGIWNGGMDLGFGRLTVLFFCMILFLPFWVFASLPLDNRICRAPIVKFLCHLVSHVLFMVLLTMVVLGIVFPIYAYTLDSFIPNWVELLLMFWLSGILVAELSSGQRTGLGIIRLVIIILAVVAALLHVFGYIYVYFISEKTSRIDLEMQLHDVLYGKNQVLAFALLFAFIQYLDFLQVHHLFGPWALIIRDLMMDLVRFLFIQLLFNAGFTLQVNSMFKPAYREATEEELELIKYTGLYESFEMLFFSMFGLVELEEILPKVNVPTYSRFLMKMVYGLYLTVTVIVLVNLLIAMMSDTYQRIQSMSDIEWKFSRAILIRQMNKRSSTPAPINMFTKLYIVLKVAVQHRMHMFTLSAQDDLRKYDNKDAFEVETGSVAAMDAIVTPGDDAMTTEEALFSIETVIPWHNVVHEYCITQGIDPVEPVKEGNGNGGSKTDD